MNLFPDPVRHVAHTLVAALDGVALDQLHAQLSLGHRGAVIRRLRGDKCGDERGWFDEAMAALQLPHYTAGNWNAFEESVSQYWLPADAMVLLVADAHRVFVERPAALQTLSRIVAGGLVSTTSRGPLPLKLVYQVPATERDAFCARLAAAGVAYAAL